MQFYIACTKLPINQLAHNAFFDLCWTQSAGLKARLKLSSRSKIYGSKFIEIEMQSSCPKGYAR